MLQSPGAVTIKPAGPGARGLQQREPLQLRSRHDATEAGLALHGWRKAPRQRRPSAAKNKQIDTSIKRNQVKKIRPFSPSKQEWTSENAESMSDKRGKLRHRGWPVCEPGSPATDPFPSLGPTPTWAQASPRALRRARLIRVQKLTVGFNSSKSR